jgi:hypothetical protein
MAGRNWEDWALALPFAAAAVVGLALNPAPSPSLTSAAVASDQVGPKYVMTVTAKRLPAECKIANVAARPAYCVALLDNEWTSMRRVR